LDTPEPSKHLLAIDETTKKKSSSFTNTCFGGDLMLTHTDCVYISFLSISDLLSIHLF
jgi:hypothetical protein